LGGLVVCPALGSSMACPSPATAFVAARSGSGRWRKMNDDDIHAWIGQVGSKPSGPIGSTMI